MASNGVDKGEGIMQLVRQTADGLADLVGQHLKLARLELTEDLVTALRRARALALLALLAIVGYALTMAGLALLLGGSRPAGIALLAVGLVHVAVGGLGALIVATRRGGEPLMNASADQAKRSFATLGSATAPAALEKTLVR